MCHRDTVVPGHQERGLVKILMSDTSDGCQAMRVKIRIVNAIAIGV